MPFEMEGDDVDADAFISKESMKNVDIADEQRGTYTARNSPPAAAIPPHDTDSLPSLFDFSATASASSLNLQSESMQLDKTVSNVHIADDERGSCIALKSSPAARITRYGADLSKVLFDVNASVSASSSCSQPELAQVEENVSTVHIADDQGRSCTAIKSPPVAQITADGADLSTALLDVNSTVLDSPSSLQSRRLDEADEAALTFRRNDERVSKQALYRRRLEECPNFDAVNRRVFFGSGLKKNALSVLKTSNLFVFLTVSIFKIKSIHKKCK